jgi:regulator of nucleoside diphosphate kinase
MWSAQPRVGVSCGSTLVYEDEKTGRQREVRLVLPREADIDRGLVSVLSPVGAALIGLPIGPFFRWRDRDGRTHGVRVLSIL